MQIKYQPQKIQTDHVKIPDKLKELIQGLARNNHEIWALERMRDGWKWGPSRCDATKENPCLVDFDSLPQHEMKYDIILAEEMIKCIIALGYQIEKSIR